LDVFLVNKSALQAANGNPVPPTYVLPISYTFNVTITPTVIPATPTTPSSPGAKISLVFQLSEFERGDPQAKFPPNPFDPVLNTLLFEVNIQLLLIKLNVGATLDFSVVGGFSQIANMGVSADADRTFLAFRIELTPPDDTQ